MTAVDGDVLTAAQYNQHVRDNILETVPAKANGSTTPAHFPVVSGTNSISMRVAESQTLHAEVSSSSASYTQLGGPTVSITTGESALCLWTVRGYHNTTGTSWSASVGVSGATDIAPSNNWRIMVDGVDGGSGNRIRKMGVHRFTNLNPGLNTFSVHYVCSSGAFDYRHLVVIPL